MGSSGGGSSGKSDFPDYMKARHDDWLSHIDTSIGTAITANPYTTAAPYNPDAVLALVISSAADFLTYINGLVTCPFCKTYSVSIE